jgi:hypothetical protein
MEIDKQKLWGIAIFCSITGWVGIGTTDPHVLAVTSAQFAIAGVCAAICLTFKGTNES